MGALLIVHPVITVPNAGDDHICAHVTIRNIGSLPDRLRAVSIDSHEATLDAEGLAARAGLVIPAHGSLELRHGFCLRAARPDRTLEPDVGLVPGHMEFEWAGPVDIDFMIGPPD